MILNSFKRFIRNYLLPNFPTLASRIIYKMYFKRRLNLINPKTFNEKIQYLKLKNYCKNPLVTKCADKYRVREYLNHNNLSHILNDLIDTWDSPREIDWERLPQKFVIKCNHGYAYNIICKNKSHLIIENEIKKLSAWLKEDFWKRNMEINYRYIQKKIICEKFIESDNGDLNLLDYKLYCFNGKAEYLMLCHGRNKKKVDYYFFNRDFEFLPIHTDIPDQDFLFKHFKPKGYEKLFEYADILATPFPFVRVDFYLNHGQVLFGEMTFTPSAGLDHEIKNETDLLLGSKIDINYNNKKRRKE